MRGARQILMFTGAGISTASGIPDFRGPQGVWRRRKPVYYQDFMTSETARIEHWDYKLEGWPLIANAQPTAVHRAIVQLEKARKLAMVLTQNVDGLHSKAGTSVDRLVEIHGSNAFVECQSCLWRDQPEGHLEYFRTHRKPPLCKCGGFLKIATVSFGQSLNPKSLERVQEAALKADLVIALGSTLSVYPAAGIPLLASRRGIPYVIINDGTTEHDGEATVSLRLNGKVEEIFPPAVTSALSKPERFN